jgi:hypothetical protein
LTPNNGGGCGQTMQERRKQYALHAMEEEIRTLAVVMRAEVQQIGDS